MATTRANPFPDMADLKELVEYLTAKSVKRFAYNGMEIEIDTITVAVSKEEPAALDVKAQSLTFTDLKKKEAEDMFWSAGK
jgi:hypothetical protein